jgi:hypothetical protein
MLECDSNHNQSIEETSDQLFLTLSEAAISGVSAPRTMCLQGVIQGNQVSILVDSGSSHTFISHDLAAKLSGISSVASSLHVRVANGPLLHCDSELLNANLSVCGYEFQSDLKVLSLSSYDMVLGLDWLESFSPMKVYWKEKWMAIPYKDTIVLLYSSLPHLPIGTVLQVCSLEVSV